MYILHDVALHLYTILSLICIYDSGSRFGSPPPPPLMGPQDQAPGSRFSCYLQHFRAPASNLHAICTTSEPQPSNLRAICTTSEHQLIYISSIWIIYISRDNIYIFK